MSCSILGSYDVDGIGQLVAHVRLVSEKFCSVDNTTFDIGVLHHIRMAVWRGISVFKSTGSYGNIDPIRNGRNILLLFDISMFQKRLVEFIKNCCLLYGLL